MNNYKKICADCIALVEKKGEWYCDECFEQKCADLDECPEGITLEETNKAEEIKTPRDYTTSGKKQDRKPREKKVDEDKAWLIQTIHNSLFVFTCRGIENLEVPNDQREVAFTYNGNEYSLTLTKHRPKK